MMFWWGSYTGGVFSLSECGCSSGSVSCDGVDEAMWGRFITGRPEERREANVAQVCCSCLILPPAVFHLSSTAAAVLRRLYFRLICHRVVLTFATAFTGQTKKASALAVLQQRTFGGVLAAMRADMLLQRNGRSDVSTQRRLNADSCRQRAGTGVGAVEQNEAGVLSMKTSENQLLPFHTLCFLYLLPH